MKEKEPMELRIKPLLPPPQKKRVTFLLPVPTIERLESYLAVFQEIYGIPADRDFVVNEMISAFLDSDRAFAAYVKNAPAASSSGSAAKKGSATSESASA